MVLPLEQHPRVLSSPGVCRVRPRPLPESPGDAPRQRTHSGRATVRRRAGASRSRTMPGVARIEDYALLGRPAHRGAGRAPRAPSTGCACRGSTRRPASPPCSTPPTPAAGCSRPSAGASARARRYRGDTLVLETEWDTAEGTRAGHRLHAARAARRADIVRIVRGLSGAVPMRGELRLRFDYGHIMPWVRARRPRHARHRRAGRRLAAHHRPGRGHEWTHGRRSSPCTPGSGCRSC